MYKTMESSGLLPFSPLPPPNFLPSACSQIAELMASWRTLGREFGGGTLAAPINPHSLNGPLAEGTANRRLAKMPPKIKLKTKYTFSGVWVGKTSKNKASKPKQNSKIKPKHSILIFLLLLLLLLLP